MNANAIYQKKFRNKKAEEKKRVENLKEIYSKFDQQKLCEAYKDMLVDDAEFFDGMSVKALGRSVNQSCESTVTYPFI